MTWRLEVPLQKLLSVVNKWEKFNILSDTLWKIEIFIFNNAR